MPQSPYGREFFDLQLMFARAANRCSGMPLARALLEYTNLYIRFGLGRDFDPEHPVWREYIAGTEREDDLEAWTHGYYQSRLPESGAPDVVSTVGCFSYARLRSGAIHIHFKNAEEGGASPLKAGRYESRIAELRELFSLVREQEDLATQVHGTSWLYNLPAYRRLFPTSYIASAATVNGKFRNVSLWGQFVGRAGAIRTAPASLFKADIARQQSLDGLKGCFPLYALAVAAPVQDFYDFLGV
ncbi:MAG TPA: hypothetical protein VL522_17725 [Bordetella sp.]|nr:hypothetical protein [Bordetella sp.]